MQRHKFLDRHRLVGGMPTNVVIRGTSTYNLYVREELKPWSEYWKTLPLSIGPTSCPEDMYEFIGWRVRLKNGKESILKKT